MVAFKGRNVILGLYKCNYSEQLSESSALPPGRNKVEGWVQSSGLMFATCDLDEDQVG